MAEPIVNKTDVVVIGAGISGLATLKCLRDTGLSAVVLEGMSEVGGLWTFREDDYGVMRFTHMEFRFSGVLLYKCMKMMSTETPDYPHNKDMAQYIVDYVKHFELEENIKFLRKVTTVERKGEERQTTVKQVKEDGKTVIESEPAEIYRSKYIAVATGHHAEPRFAKFPSQDSFKGVNLCMSALGQVLGWYQTMYSVMPQTSMLAWNLNPKMKPLQSQPTVSATLVHHIQRQNIKIVPNVQRVEGSRVFFMNGESEVFDHIILCTGYKIDLPFLSNSIQETVLNKDTNEIKLYKNVFSLEIGSSLAFIGFVQPASDGMLTMAELQARWFAEMCNGQVKLPSKGEMNETIEKEKEFCANKYHKSDRHTIQRDPIVYNDEIAEMIGAKPIFMNHPGLAWRLLLSSCGAYQWRLQGPNRWRGAKDVVMKVPLTELMHYSGILVVVIIGWILYYFYSLSF